MNDEWVETTLGKAAEVVGGGTPSTKVPEFWGGDVAWVGPTEIVRQDGQRVGTSERRITRKGLGASSAKLLPRNTVLVTTRASVGFTAIADTEMATNQGFQSLIPGPDLLPGFLMYWVQTNRDEFRSRAGGSTFPEVSKTKVKTIPISYPPLPVQRRIVDLLEHLDSHITNLKIEQEALATRHSALRQEIMGAWDYEELSSFATIEAALVDPRKADYQALGHVGVDRIEKGTGRLLPLQTAREEALISAKYLFGPLDVIYAKIRPNLRKVAYPGFSGLCSADAYPLRPLDGLPPRLLMEAMLMPDVVETVVAKSGRTKMPKVNRKELFTVEVPLRASEPAEWVAAEQTLADSALAVDALDNEVMSLVSVRSALLSALLSREVEIPASYDDLLDGVA